MLNQSELYRFDLQYGSVIGVDEAGRGPLAGPVVAAAAILKEGVIEDKENSELLQQLLQINDSKKLTEKKREKLFDIINNYFYVGIGVADHLEIDEINILNATFLAMRRALEELKTQGVKIEDKMVLIDGNHKIRKYDGKQEFVIKGDSKSISIAAASIIAKVTRDRMMVDAEKKYPIYEFEKHKGYGTKKHRELLLQYGPCTIHRKSFLRKILTDYEFKIENGKLF